MIRQKVANLINDCKTNDPYVIAKKENITIIFKKFNKKVKGVYVYTENEILIGINSIFSENQKKIILSHELGHHFLHKEECNFMECENLFPSSSIKEIEANKFASELLIQNNRKSRKFISKLKRFEVKKMLQYKFIRDDECFYNFYKYFVKVG